MSQHDRETPYVIGMLLGMIISLSFVVNYLKIRDLDRRLGVVEQNQKLSTKN